MNFDVLKDSIGTKKTNDDALTIVEHLAILLHFKQIGYFGRDDAIKITRNESL